MINGTFSQVASIRRVGCLRLLAACLFVVSFAFENVASAGILLPPLPGNFVSGIPDASGVARTALIINNVPVAFVYDEFISYSTQLLDQLQANGHIPMSYGDYNISAGVGGLDVVVYTQAGGVNNQGVGPGGAFNFEDPAPATVGGGPGSDTATEVWGNGSNPNGPVLVDDVLAYLQAIDPNSVRPAFLFDNNQTGADPSTLISANVAIYDPIGMMEIDSWSLDTNDNGTFDPDSKVLVQGDGVEFLGADGVTYKLDANKGSGKFDFIAVAPTMDLSLYAGLGYQFVVTVNLMGLNNGGEELSFTGTVSSAAANVIPEPGSFAIFGLGLAFTAVGFRTRSRRESSFTAS